MSGESPIIRAAVFDLDDTLFPERDYVRSGYRAVAKYLMRVTGENRGYEEWLWERFLSGKVSGAFDELGEHFRLNQTHYDILALVDVYREHRPDIKPYDGVCELLESLHEKLRLGILSDGYLPAQQLKLEALEIERFVDAVLFTEEISRDAWKPSPVGFEAIREKLDVPHQQCAYVGDNPAKDFLAPNELGWLTVQYVHADQIHSRKTPPEDGTPQIVVHSLPALANIFTP